MCSAQGSKCRPGCLSFKGLCMTGCFGTSEISTTQWRDECLELCSLTNNCPRECFLLHNNCIKECPKGSYQDIYKPGYCEVCDSSCKECEGASAKMCTLCNDNYYNNTGECVSQCPQDMVVYRQQCLAKCPAIWHNQKCLDACPLGFYNESFLCKPCHKECIRCSFEGPQGCTQCRNFNFSDICVSECPQTHLFHLGVKCLPKCPQYNDNFTCVESCGNGKYHMENRCVAKCPANAMYILNGNCVEECPNVRIDNSCLSYCPRGMVVVDGECKQKCSNEFPFVDRNGICNQCPSNQVVFNSSCVKECPQTHGFINPKSLHCEDTCSYHTYQNKCLLSCPINTYTDPVSSNCVKCSPVCNQCFGPSEMDCFECKRYNSSVGCKLTCPRAEPVILNEKHCVANCPKGNYISHNHCVENCPRNVPYRYKNRCNEVCPESTFIYSNDTKCVDFCGGEFYQHNRFCYRKCPFSYVTTDQFPNESPDVLKYMFNMRPLNGCVVYCPPEFAVTLDWTLLLYARFNETISKFVLPDKYLPLGGDVKCTKECLYGFFKANINGTDACVKYCDDFDSINKTMNHIFCVEEGVVLPFVKNVFIASLLLEVLFLSSCLWVHINIRKHSGKATFSKLLQTYVTNIESSNE